jgi:hypothetical protein
MKRREFITVLGGAAARRARTVSQDAGRRLLRHAAARGAALCGFRESFARNAFELPEAAFKKRFSDGYSLITRTTLTGASPANPRAPATALDRSMQRPLA